MKKILIFLFLFLLTLACNSKENLYTNNSIGFSIKYDQEITRRYDYYGEDYKYYFLVDLIPLNDPMLKTFIRTTKEEYIKKMENENFNFKVNPDYNMSEKYIKNKVKTIGFSYFIIGDISIYKKLEFIKDDYIVIITIYFNDRQARIYKKFPEFFEVRGEFIEWKEPLPDNSIKFYNMIKNKSKKIPKELINLEEYFDTIVKTLKLFNAKPVYLIPTVDNLRFRNTPTLEEEKFKTFLKKGEKLKLLDKGNTETIKGVKGTWVKVETESVEVGWCFDAYLKPYDEVKKK